MPMILCVVVLALMFLPTIGLFGGSDGPSSNKSATGSFTIQQVLSAPFPKDLVAAGVKARFAWVFNAEGKRNIWVAEPARDGHGYDSRQLTNYSDDDGQEIEELVWAPDAESIAYVRGGDFEFTSKPPPNPAGLAGGVEQDVWVVSLSSGEERKIGEGHSPTISPKGDLITYVFNNQVWVARVDGGGKPEQLIHSTGESESLRWSPDGRYLAFVSKRGDHSFVGVYAIGPKTLIYMQPSTSCDFAPAWSPDSRRIAFLRVPSSQYSHMFEPIRTGEPWSILIAEVDSGKGREIWRARKGRGSVFWGISGANEILWGDGDRIVFPWEDDGWTHLYSISVEGGTPMLLTPGSFEVEYVTLSPDRKELVYSSNQNDIDRRHVWKVAVEGNKPTALTTGSGIETAPALGSDNQTVAVLHSDAQVPLRPAIVGGERGIRDLAPNTIPANFPAEQMVSPQQVVFSAKDGMKIHGQVFLPTNAAKGSRHPAVIFLHGGSRRQMYPCWHDIDYYSNAYGMNQFLASRGYVVLSVNYRSGVGYGRDFREALNYGVAGASEYNDVEGAGIYLRARADVDPNNIGLWGGSYGGYLTALGLARSSDLFAAGVDMHGVYDWNVLLRRWVPGYQPEAHPAAKRLAWQSSPGAWVKKWRSPVLLVQGGDDRTVPFVEIVSLSGALNKQGIELRELIFPDEVHDFLLNRTWIDAYAATYDFFDRHLKQPHGISKDAAPTSNRNPSSAQTGVGGKRADR
jgi:dipeptidyl aminopeptidase/acylaminoacyl peptidase